MDGLVSYICINLLFFFLGSIISISIIVSVTEISLFMTNTACGLGSPPGAGVSFAYIQYGVSPLLQRAAILKFRYSEISVRV